MDSPEVEPSFFESHALHAVAVDELTRVQVGQGQPGSTTVEPLKLNIKFIIYNLLIESKGCSGRISNKLFLVFI